MQKGYCLLAVPVAMKKGPVECLAVLGPNGRVIASGSDDYTIKLWDTRSGALLRTIGKEDNTDPSTGHTSECGTLLSSTPSICNLCVSAIPSLVAQCITLYLLFIPSSILFFFEGRWACV